MKYKLYVIELSPFDIFHAIYIVNTCQLVEANSFFIKKKQGQRKAWRIP
jgi:hypothetical protein